MENENKKYKGLSLGWTFAAIIDTIVLFVSFHYIWIKVFAVSFVILVILTLILTWDWDRRLEDGIERWHRPWWWGL